MTWYIVPNSGKKRLPKWMRLFALDENGDFWVPAIIGGSEMAVLLACGFDGEAICTNDNHVYARAAWMAREYPKLAASLEKMRARVQPVGPVRD
ncbi:MAG TPA: hypothetical protein VGR63_02435 [Casimicrobiaceae bacterium]|nr:hypothetical protein [Casimicrobiaceae bacterium]